MHNGPSFSRGFTLIELVAVITIVAVLASLLLPVLNMAKAGARRTACVSNLKQINLAVRMYAADSQDKLAVPPGFHTSIEAWYRYKELVKSYLGRTGGPSPSDKLFACPADSFFYSASGYHLSGLCTSPRTGFTSYIFNAGDLVGTNGYPGISGESLAAMREPVKTVLVCEAAAFTPFSWHSPTKQPSEYRFKDSKNVLSFVDGHVQYVRMFWSGVGEAWQYNPPANYEYKWSNN